MHYTSVLMMKEVNMQRSSTCRIIGINNKPIPMTDFIINIINKQAKEDKQGIEFSGINKNTIVNDYKESGNDYDSDCEDDNKSYKMSDDPTLDCNAEIPDDSDTVVK